VIVQQLRWAAGEKLGGLTSLVDIDPQWLLVFAAPAWFADRNLFATLRQRFPAARLSGCSTAGEITRSGVSDGSCTITAVHWPAGPPTTAIAELASLDDSLAAGMRLGRQLGAPSAVVVFTPGVDINASALVEGLVATLPPTTPIVGGLAGDGGAFRQTFTLSDQGVSSRAIVAVGLPPGITVGRGSFGGWKPFGPAHKVTRSQGNILFELDGEPALAVYKRQLGEHANGLPLTGLMFPFEMLTSDHAQTGLIRTMHRLDESNGSLVLAGDIDRRGYLRLMHASTDALVDGAATAAEAAMVGNADCSSLALLISCIGRKLVMAERVDEEVTAAVSILGAAVVTGFYSYGEISSTATNSACQLHNQTMTITCIRESP
jgi:hypothetical protein